MLMVYIIEMNTSPGVWEMASDNAFTTKEEALKYAKHLTNVSMGKLTTRVKVLKVTDKA